MYDLIHNNRGDYVVSFSKLNHGHYTRRRESLVLAKFWTNFINHDTEYLWYKLWNGIKEMERDDIRKFFL